MSEISKQCIQAVTELCEIADLKEGQILVIGCSSSEVLGKKIGSFSAIRRGYRLVVYLIQLRLRHIVLRKNNSFLVRLYFFEK